MWKKSVSKCVVARCSVVLPLSRRWTSKARGGTPEPAPLLPSTSQCLSSLHIATSRFSFTFAAVTIYVGECSTSSTVSVTRVTFTCVFIQTTQEQLKRNVENSFDDVCRKCSGYLNSCTVRTFLRFTVGSSSAVENKICYEQCGENLSRLFAWKYLAHLESSSFSSNRIVRVARLKVSCMTSAISMRDRIIERWLSIQGCEGICDVEFCWDICANFSQTGISGRGQLYTMQFFL